MSVHGGRFAAVNGIGTAHAWSINDSTAPAKGAASNTKNAFKRLPGVNSWAGSYEAFGHTPTVMPGDVFTFLGYTAPDDDSSGAGVTYSGQAMVDQVVITWNWKNAEIIGHVVNFSGHLALTIGSGTVTDSSTPTFPSGVVPTPKIDKGAGFVDLANVAQAVLTISAANQAYVNSSTVVSGVSWTGRRSGPIDAGLALTVEDNIRSGANCLVKSEDVALRIFVDATTYWAVKYMHVRDYSGLKVDRQSAAIIQHTINLDFNAWTQALGYGAIRVPGGSSDWWPI